MKNITKKATTIITAAAVTLGMMVAPAPAMAEEKAPTPTVNAVQVGQPFFFQLNGPLLHLLLGIGGLSLILSLLSGNAGSSGTTKGENGTDNFTSSGVGNSEALNNVVTIKAPRHDPYSQLCQRNFFRTDKAQYLFLELLNEKRREAGIQELVPGAPGTDAERWVKYSTMRNTNKEYTPTPKDIKHWDGLFDYVDDEVLDQGNNCSIERHFNSLWGSPGHRRTMMNPQNRYAWTDTGFREDNGKYTFVFTQVYKR